MPTLLTEKTDGSVTHTPIGIDAVIALVDAHLGELSGTQIISVIRERDFLLDLRNELSHVAT